MRFNLPIIRFSARPIPMHIRSVYRPLPCTTRLVLAVLSAGCTAPLQAQQVSFDRPGIGFGTEVLTMGQFTWEQGLPDFSRNRQDHQLELFYAASTLWRLGLGAGLELQLASDLMNRQAGSEHATGAGDSSVSLKYALPAWHPDIDWALMATYSQPTGQAPFRADSNSRSLAISASQDVSDGRSYALYLGYSNDGNNSNNGHSWTFSPSYTFYSGAMFSAYTELGWSHGADNGSSAGGGGIWRLSNHLQLDLWLLRGISSSATDWQGGFGIAWTPD